MFFFVVWLNFFQFYFLFPFWLASIWYLGICITRVVNTKVVEVTNNNKVVNNTKEVEVTMVEDDTKVAEVAMVADKSQAGP